jgi:predicted amidohydrolase YtcJ
MDAFYGIAPAVDMERLASPIFTQAMAHPGVILGTAAVVLCCVFSVVAQARPAADLIIRNAKIWTVDAARPEAQAVAILGDRIVAVGSNQDLDVWLGPNTKMVDAAGKRLLPGFNDAHVHFATGGAQLDNLQLDDVTSQREFARRIAERAAKSGKGEWMLGGNWDETKWDLRSFLPKS